MAHSTVEVYNLALSACGSDALVDDPDDNTREAKLCRLWLPMVRDYITSLAPWSCAKRSIPLSLFAQRGHGSVWSPTGPGPSYPYSYTVPENVIVPYHLFSFLPFSMEGHMLFTSDPNPILQGLVRVEEPAEWDDQFFLAVVHYLAARIARPLTGASDLVSQNFEIAKMHVEDAIIRAAEMQPQPPTESLPEWITARGYSAGGRSRYFYDFQQLNPVMP